MGWREIYNYVYIGLISGSYNIELFFQYLRSKSVILWRYALVARRSAPSDKICLSSIRRRYDAILSEAILDYTYMQAIPTGAPKGGEVKCMLPDCFTPKKF